MTPTLYLESVCCLQQEDIMGKDFIYVQIVGAKPGITLIGCIGSGETKQLTHAITLPDGPCKLELWEKDTIATSDRIGAVDLQQCNQNVPQEVTIKNDGTCYRLGFRVVKGN